MNIQISGHNLEITDALHQYVSDKFKKLERHSQHIMDVHVTLIVEKKNIQKAEAQVNLRRGKRVFADSSTEDMYASIDSLVTKLDKQVLKHKDQMTDH